MIVYFMDKQGKLERMLIRGIEGPFNRHGLAVGNGSFLKGRIVLGGNVEVGYGSYIVPEAGKIVRIGDFARIGNQVSIEGDVTIGDGCLVEEGTRIFANTAIGTGNKFYNCSIGTLPQGSIQGGKIYPLIIGDNNSFREYVDVSRGTRGMTVIGSRNSVFSHTHIAHDCVLGDCNEIISGVLLAGHVNVENYVRISGGAAVAQFVRLGSGSFVGGTAGVNGNVLPYSRVDGSPASFKGINFERLRRMHGKEGEEGFQRAYEQVKKIYDDCINNKKIADRDLPRALSAISSCSPYSREFISFLNNLRDRNKRLLRFRRRGGMENDFEGQ